MTDPRRDALELAEQWKGRADDCGRLARAVLSATPSSASGEWAVALVQSQALDEGLWFEAVYSSEKYLQQALKALHAAVEADAAVTLPAAAQPETQQGDAGTPRTDALATMPIDPNVNYASAKLTNALNLCAKLERELAALRADAGSAKVPEVIAAFIAPDNSQWQGMSVNVTKDGRWWRYDGKKWVEDTVPLSAVPIEQSKEG